MANNKLTINAAGGSVSIGNVIQGDDIGMPDTDQKGKPAGLTREGSFVFVSHCSEDKPRLRPYLECLMDEGIPLWIDRPEACGFGARYMERYRIPYGADWRREIRQALEFAKAVLVFWSRHTFERQRDEFWQEVQHGDGTGRLFQVLIDRTMANGHPLLECLDRRLTRYQIADLTGASGAGHPGRELALLAGDLRNRLAA